MTEWVDRATVETIQAVRSAGLVVEDCRILSSANRLVLALEPCNSVAKIVPVEAAGELAAELAVARHAQANAGPVARPDVRVEPQPHRLETVAFSLWERMTILGPVADSELCDAYSMLRACLDSFAGTLPDFRAGISRATLSVHQRTALAPNDALLVQRVLADGLSSLSSFTWASAALHGDPHSGNVVRTADGPQWLDFEAACSGPVEWDLSALHECSSAISHNGELLAALVKLRRACVVVWCASKPNPKQFEVTALEHHLGVLRGNAEGAGSPTPA